MNLAYKIVVPSVSIALHFSKLEGLKLPPLLNRQNTNRQEILKAWVTS